jgi:tetratricopeptide (TPR) repeat protein
MSTALLVRDAAAHMSSDPARAAALCREALTAEPGNGDARLLLSEALRLQGDLEGAREAAETQAAAQPSWFGAHRQLGVVHAAMGRSADAAASLQKAAELNPDHPTIWRDLGDQLGKAGDVARSQEAYARHGASRAPEPALLEAARALSQNDFRTAQPIIAAHLESYPNDVFALRMLSEAHARADRSDLAEQALRRCLEIAPGFTLARHNLGQLLNGCGRYEESLAEAQELIRRDPENKGSQRLLAATHVNRGEFDSAMAIYERHLRDNPRQPTIWMSYGHILKTVGRTKEAIKAYRESIKLAPGLGLSYWSLANLKTFKFSDGDIAAMEQQVRRWDIPEPERINFSYALGKAYEDLDNPAAAFEHYQDGARRQRAIVKYSAQTTEDLVRKSIALFTRDFFESRAGSGAKAPDPIFVVGLPRSGSTLVEQVLASHSAVEGTMELPDLGALAIEIAGQDRISQGGTYLDRLPDLEASALRERGESYLRTTRVQRQLGLPFFIDKTPNNWALVGLIRLILPNAKVIDARRQPMACCFSCFKQHFALGQTFTYDLSDIGHYYAQYVALMDHWDEVAPGFVHRVIFEDLVNEPETHIRRLLEFCGLPFEPGCVQPHLTKRAVRTASSEQVRQPISASRVDDWRKFDPWLGPLKRALGPTLQDWRGAASKRQ